MKILDPQNAMLTDVEALRHVRETHDRYRDHADYQNTKDAKLRGLRTVLTDALTYFNRDSALSSPQTASNPPTKPRADRVPTTHTAPSPPTTNPADTTSETEHIPTLVRELRTGWPGLTKTEILQIANLRPRGETELELAVEEIEERFDAGQRERLLELCWRYFGSPEDGGDAEAMQVDEG